MKTLSLYHLIGITVAIALNFSHAFAAEPNLADYTAYPVFTVNPVKPNILIMLDNSGSMNFNAYGSPQTGGGLVTDQPYVGIPYPTELTYRVATSSDDAEEWDNGTTAIDNNSDDLDLGGFGTTSPNTIGVRFQGIEIPQDAIITDAWLEFTVQRVPSGTEGAIGTEYADISLEIVGEATDSALTFANTTYNISSTASRPETTNSVIWNDSTNPTTQPWDPVNEVKQTPGIVSIIQEIVDRSGWESGNAMAFKIRHDSTGQTGKRDAYSFDGDSSKAPTLHIRYRMPEREETLYYGYFNPEWFYTYSSNKFIHQYKKVDYDYSQECWNVIYPSDLSNPGEESDWTGSDCLESTDIVSNDLWDGNWLNWATMRRIDVARKVIMGGLATSRQGSGNQVNYGENPAQSSRYFNRNFNSSIGSAVTPHSNPNNTVMYGVKDGYIYVDTDNDNSPYDGYERYTLAIDKRIDFDVDDFDEDQNVSGVMQKFWDKAYWGNEFFYSGSGNNVEGGFIASSIGSNQASLITDLQNTGADTWTPLAEAFYVATQYFKQEDPDSDLGFHGSAIGAINNTNDPYYQDSQFIECAKSFVILLTDGASTKDGQIPDFLKDYDGDGDNTSCNEYSSDNCDYDSGGSDFLDDVALYARTNDLRSDLDGDQNLLLYTVYAFGTDPNAEQLLKDAARNGGFEDLNGNGVPDGDYSDTAANRKEWDKNEDGNPDTYFEAQDGYKLEDQLIAAINDILERASSGTAVSVLATTSEGEGTLTQTYFRPTVNTADDQIKWVGYLQSLWVDNQGNTREDTNGNLTLDPGEDLIIQYHTGADGNTVIRRYAVDNVVCNSTNASMDDETACSGESGTETGQVNDNCYCKEDNYPEIEVTCSSSESLIETSIACAGVDGNENGTFNDGDCICDDGAIDEISMDAITPIMEAGSVLAGITNPDIERTIFTTLSGDGSESFHGGIEFSQTNADALKPYFGVKDSATWGYLGKDNSTNGVDQDDRVSNLIRFIRGYEDGYSGETEIRSRLLTLNGTDVVWRLGDIVHSTPITVAAPAEQLDLIYSDQSYDEFYRKYEDREHVIYSGGNDGMLHAFTLWQYDEENSKYVAPTAAAATEEIGTELWAYIPRTLLPHLKWLPRKDYTHVYYVDLQPKVVDAQIFPTTDSVHTNGWGTVLIGGLRMGGKKISVTDDFDADATTADTTETFTPSYFAIDITEPRNPKLLWEKEYSGMDFTWAEPNIIKVGDEWFAVLGSGPDSYDGSSSSTGKVFIVDLETGTPYTYGTNEWRFELPETQAFMGSAVSLDYGLNYNVDSVYIGQSYDTNTNANKDPNWLGSMYRITIPWACGTDCSGKLYGTIGEYDTNNDGNYDCECRYNEDPDFWSIGKLFDSPAPITAPGSLSTDFSKNIWLYFGTGRYLSQEDKSDVETNYFYGLKDPFYNRKHSTAGNDREYNYAAGVNGTDNYYTDQTKTLTMDENDLLDADPYSIIHPWGYYEAPVGDCSTVPYGAIGDIYNDGSCFGEYDWPDTICGPATEVDDAAVCASIDDGSLGTTYKDGSECYCEPFDITELQWICIEKVANGCDGVLEGVVDDTAEYQSMYWQATEVVSGGCDGVNSGDIVDDGNCLAEGVTPPAWSYTERPIGDCATAGVTEGMEDLDVLGDGGSCQAGYWACTETVTDGCLTVDFTATTGFLGTNGDGDYFGDGSCMCTFTEDPVPMVTSSTSLATLTFAQQVTNARKYEGWSRTLPDPGERSVQKPALLGGITLFTSYVPSDDLCSFGGNSYLYALYFETGTAYAEAVFTGSVGTSVGTPIIVQDRANLGTGLASSPSIHIGSQTNNEAEVLIEKSTGAVEGLTIDPAFDIRSSLRYWQQK